MQILAIPSNTQEYYDRVIHQCNILIKMNIWTIPEANFIAWINQFQTLEEKFFCACLLSRLIFRSKSQIYSLITALFQSNLNNTCFDEIITQGELIKKLTSKKGDPNIRLVPVINEEDPPTKSGPLIIRYIKKRFNLNEKWMNWSSKIPSILKEKNNFKIIFIDDFCGTGRQFEKFFQQIIEQSGFEDEREFWRKVIEKKIRIIYSPLIAYEAGFYYLKMKYPFISFTSSELLKENNSFFQEKNWKELSNEKIKVSDAQEWLENFWSSKGFTQSSIPFLGYENMGLTFGFEHGTPNNTLPIFWQSNPNWKPLLER